MDKKTFAHFDASRTIVCYWSDKTDELVFEGSAMEWLQDERTLTLKEFYQSLLNQKNFDSIQPFIIWLNRHFLPFVSKRKDIDIFPKDKHGDIWLKKTRIRTVFKEGVTFYHCGSLMNCLVIPRAKYFVGAYDEVILAEHPLNTGGANYFVSHLYLIKQLRTIKEDAVYLRLKCFLESIVHQYPIILAPDAIDLYVSIFQNPMHNRDAVFEKWWTFVTRPTLTFEP